MKAKIKISIIGFLALSVGACVANNSNAPQTTVGPSPAASPSPTSSPVVSSTGNAQSPSAITLAVLDALLTNENFVSDLKSKVQVTDQQLDQLKKASTDEVARLRSNNAEDSSLDTNDARSRATEQITSILGEQKAAQFNSFVNDFWARGGESEPAEKSSADSIVRKPNAVPTDTRVVVNIPAYRMDLFKDGSLVKSYKIGIGYPEFPLPQGLRKAQTIIFNPTWTPPDSPWVAKMKNVTAGEKVEAGSKLNPLGPIKIPIGMPSLIHGGKSIAKLGTFASHGCVGLTNAQVKDFAKVLSQIAGTDLTDQSINSYLKDPTQTRAVKLKQTIPVELRYETIVVEGGALHIYKDVYDQNSNTEENLQKVLEANGTSLDSFAEDERAKVLAALNSMSTHPKAMPSPTIEEKKDKQKRVEKKPAKNQKEIVVELKTLAGRGYPAPVNLDNGTGKSVVTATAR